MMTKQMQTLYQPSDVELDENQNILRMFKIEKMAYQILKVCQTKVSPTFSETNIMSNYSLYPSDTKNKQENVKSMAPELQPSTSLTYESELSILDTEVNITDGHNKSEKQKKITILQRSQIELERFRPIRPEPKLPPQKEVQPLRPIVKQAQLHSPSLMPEVQLFRPLLRQPHLHLHTKLQPIKSILMRKTRSHAQDKLDSIQRRPQSLIDHRKDLQLLQIAISQLQKAQLKATLKNQIMYNGRNILNLKENLQPHPWQLESALHRTKSAYAFDF